MKTRNDFVSNSSSCSFVVNDIHNFKTKLAELCKDPERDFYDTWWLSFLEITFEFDNSEENRELFKDTCSFFEYVSTADDEVPSLVRTTMTFDYFMDLDARRLDLVKGMRVHSVDMNDSNGINSLAFLFYAMKSCKIDVDNSTSEQDFGLFNMAIPEKVIDLALAARGKV